MQAPRNAASQPNPTKENHTTTTFYPTTTSLSPTNNHALTPNPTTTLHLSTITPLRFTVPHKPESHTPPPQQQ
jgi:hypothetical protein